MRHSVRRPVVNLVPRAHGPAAAPPASPTFRPGEFRGSSLPIESIVTARERARWSHGLADEYRRVVELARRPVSLVEIGVALAVSVAVARVLVRDLVDRGFLDVHVPPASADGRPPAGVLTRLLEGLRAR